MVVVLAIFTPVAGREKEVEEALLKLGSKVQENEPRIDVSKPLKVTRHSDGRPEFCVYERCVCCVSGEVIC